MKIVVIIQARMGSTRLPGKVMKTIMGRTVLAHVVERVKQSSEVDEIIIATTIKPDDEVIASEASRLSVKYYKGSEDDVLSRYFYAAKESQAEIVVRITSDCPLIDPIIMDNMIKAYKLNTCDYLSNTLIRTFPRGLDCEVFSFQALERAFKEGIENYQKEHVTPFIYENEHLFILNHYLDEDDNSHLRCTLDTLEDYEVITKLLQQLKSPYSYKDLLQVFRTNPDIAQINSNILQKGLRG